MTNLALIETERNDWASLLVLADRSARVPESLRNLISATSEENAEGFYWELENTVVVQGQLFEAAPAVVSVLVASLLGELSEPALGWVLELLFQLVSGESHEEATGRGQPRLGEECRARAREGLWVLYGQLRGQYKEMVKDILEVIELDRSRLNAICSAKGI